MITKISGSSENEEVVIRIINEGLQLCHPYNALKEKISAAGSRRIIIDGKEVMIEGKLYVLGWGKAAGSMAASVERILGPEMIDDGVVVTVPGAYQTKKIKVLVGGHPLATEESVMASKEITKLARKCGEKDIVLCLVSGGGSALFSYPAPEVGLEAKREATKTMLLNRLEDGEINIVRKHLSVVKGGKLAKMIYPASIYNLVISDYIGNVLDVIASGPTVPDSYTFRDAMGVIERHGLADKMPRQVVDYIRENIGKEKNETIKSDSPVFRKAKNIIFLDNGKALLNFKKAAEKNGFKGVYVRRGMFHEDTAKCAGELIRDVQDKAGNNSRFVVLAGGEVPVKVKSGGLGGRAQHFAAVMIPHLKRYGNSVFAAFSTDGMDYMKGVAGGIIDDRTAESLDKKKLCLEKFIENTNTYVLHKEMGTLLVTKSPTETHISDIYIFAHFGKEE